VAVPELLALVLCETPDVAMRARALLRERLLAEHSEAVADIYWRRQDEAQAPREIDACDAYKRWRDRRDDEAAYYADHGAGLKRDAEAA